MPFHKHMACLIKLSLTPVTLMSVFYSNQLLHKEGDVPRMNSTSRFI